MRNCNYNTLQAVLQTPFVESIWENKLKNILKISTITNTDNDAVINIIEPLQVLITPRK